MEFNIAHKFSKNEAKQRIIAALLQGKAKVPPEVSITEERWDGDTLHFGFTVQGQSITGHLDVKENEYYVDAKLPFMLRLFEGRIKKAIEEQTQAMLAQK